MTAVQPDLTQPDFNRPALTQPDFNQPDLSTLEAQPPATALSLRRVSKAFGGVRALDGVDLDVYRGEFLAVLGPSGCGKTTLLRSIAGFERIDAGRITLNHHVVALDALHLPTHRRGIGVVPQEGALFPHLSVADNVGFGLPGRRRAKAGIVADYLALVGLAGLGSRMPHELSGGQQQRVALARALAPEPEVVLLDEPFSALDAGLRADLRDDVRRVLAEQGVTAILVTHDQGEALSMADRVAVMASGRVVQVGTPVDLYTRPANTWVAGFVGEACWLDAEASGAVAVTALGAVALASDAAGPVRVLVRPEQITLDAHGAPARVDRVAFHGHDALVWLRLADGHPVLLRLADPVLLPGAGDVVGLSVRGSGLICEADA